MDYGAKHNLIQTDTRLDLLGNRLVLIAPKDSKNGDVKIALRAVERGERLVEEQETIASLPCRASGSGREAYRVYVSHTAAEVRRIATHVVLLDGGRAAASDGLELIKETDVHGPE